MEFVDSNVIFFQWLSDGFFIIRTDRQTHREIHNMMPCKTVPNHRQYLGGGGVVVAGNSTSMFTHLYKTLLAFCTRMFHRSDMLKYKVRPSGALPDVIHDPFHYGSAGINPESTTLTS